MNSSEKWSLSKSEIFWKDIAPGEHVLQIYDNVEGFINVLASFAGTGINAGESVIIIADPQHAEMLKKKLKEHVLDLDLLAADNRLIVLDAQHTLDSFMQEGWPKEEKFRQVAKEIIKRAKGTENRHVRAFGEMVALLWDKGNHEATLRLEEYWDTICKEENISLLCAYPREIFLGEAQRSIGHICNAHSKIIKDTEKPLTELMYQDVLKTA